MAQTDTEHLDEQHRGALALLCVEGWNANTIRTIIAAALVCGHRVGHGRGWAEAVEVGATSAGRAGTGGNGKRSQPRSQREVRAFDGGYDAGYAKGLAAGRSGFAIYPPSDN